MPLDEEKSKKNLVLCFSGELVCAMHKDKPWGKLKIPNSFVRGLFDMIHEPGVELPPSGEDGKQLNAHVSVFRPEEIEAIGGPDKITERGHHFRFTLGRIKHFTPIGWSEMSDCWVVRVHSPELERLRRSYGLTEIPMRGTKRLYFHITFGVRRRDVLSRNALRKAASVFDVAWAYRLRDAEQQQHAEEYERARASPASRCEDSELLGPEVWAEFKKWEVLSGS